jgi:hypothetical protein
MVLVALGGAVTLGIGLAFARWQTRAYDARTPVGERRVIPPALEREPAPEALGYRESRPPPRPRRKRRALRFDPGLERGPDVRTLVEPTMLAVRVELVLGTRIVVRIEASREGPEVVVRAFAAPPKRHVADWEERLEQRLRPMLDNLLEELTGVRPATVPPTRVAVELEDEREVEARRALDRRGWPQP